MVFSRGTLQSAVISVITVIFSLKRGGVWLEVFGKRLKKRTAKKLASGQEVAVVTKNQSFEKLRETAFFIKDFQSLLKR